MEMLDHDHSTKKGHFNARQHIRDDVSISADIRVSGCGRNKVKIVDLSQTGFRMECLTYVPDNRMLYLTIPGFAQLEAKIAWRTEWLYGCEFVRPLHAAIYEHIAKTHPALVS